MCKPFEMGGKGGKICSNVYTTLRLQSVSKASSCSEFGVLRCDTVQSSRLLPTFQREHAASVLKLVVGAVRRQLRYVYREVHKDYWYPDQ